MDNYNAVLRRMEEPNPIVAAILALAMEKKFGSMLSAKITQETHEEAIVIPTDMNDA